MFQYKLRVDFLCLEQWFLNFLVRSHFENCGLFPRKVHIGNREYTMSRGFWVTTAIFKIWDNGFIAVSLLWRYRITPLQMQFRTPHSPPRHPATKSMGETTVTNQHLNKGVQAATDSRKFRDGDDIWILRSKGFKKEVQCSYWVLFLPGPNSCRLWFAASVFLASKDFLAEVSSISACLFLTHFSFPVSLSVVNP